MNRLPIQDFSPAIKPEIAQYDRVIETIQPSSITSEANGTIRIDMGKNYTGWLKIQLFKGSQDTVEFRIADKVEEDCTFQQRYLFSFGKHKEGNFCNEFNYFSGRYITILGPNPGIPVRIGDVTGLALGNMKDKTLTFGCSDELLNKILETDLRTFQANTVNGVTMDCPHRERLGYGETGCSTTWGCGLAGFDSAAFYKNYLLMWGDCQEADGYFPHTVPGIRGGGGTAWSGYPITGMYDYYLQFADQELLKRMYPGLKRWIRYLDDKIEDGLLTRYEIDEWGFLGDWATPDGDDWGISDAALFFNNCVYAAGLWKMAYLAEKIREGTDARFFEKRHLQLSKAIHEKYYHPGQNIYFTEAARYQAAALHGKVVPAALVPEVQTRLADIVNRRGYLDGGSAGLTLLLREMSEFPEGSMEIYRWLKRTDFPSYGYFLARDQTTWPEMWDMRDIYGGSRIHTCYTGVAGWILHSLSGIQYQPGNDVFRHFRISPVFPEDLDSLNCQWESPYGMVGCVWIREGEQISLTIDIPFNTDAEVIFGVEKINMKAGHYKFTITSHSVQPNL